MKLHYANISSHNEFYRIHKPSNIINLYIYWKGYYYRIQIVCGGKVSQLYSNSKHLIIRKKNLLENFHDWGLIRENLESFPPE